MLSLHAAFAQIHMQDAARLADDKICAACAEIAPTYYVVVHGVPVIVCNEDCRQALIYYWRPELMLETPSWFSGMFSWIRDRVQWQLDCKEMEIL